MDDDFNISDLEAKLKELDEEIKEIEVQHVARMIAWRTKMVLSEKLKSLVRRWMTDHTSNQT